MNISSEGEKRIKGEREKSPSPLLPVSPSQITILIADDHPIFRKGLLQVIAIEPDLAIVGEAADGQTALEQIKTQQPDVAVLDIRMAGIDDVAYASLLPVPLTTVRQPCREIGEALKEKGSFQLVVLRSTVFARHGRKHRRSGENVIPRIGSLFCKRLGEVLTEAEVVVIETRGVKKEELQKHLRPDHIVIDLVNLEKARQPAASSNYEGICW